MSLENAAGSSMDFMKNMWGNMGMSLPGMITPTFDVAEIEKRVKDLKAVEGWLKMNLSMLQMTIQGLEMQCSTLTAVKAMGDMVSKQAGAGANDTSSAEGATQAAMWPWTMMQQMQETLQKSLAEQSAATAEAAKDASKLSGK
jgi:hypothetical protein